MFRVAASMALLAGCIPLADNNVCDNNDDCDSGELCTSVSECAAEGTAPSLRISWTIGGESPLNVPAVCDGISELSVTISSPTETLTFAPIACSAGSFGFASVPRSYDTVRLDAKDDNGIRLATARGTADRDEAEELQLDLPVP